MFLLCEEGSRLFPCFLQITKAFYSKKGKGCGKNNFTCRDRDVLAVVLGFTPATFYICVYRKDEDFENKKKKGLSTCLKQ